MTQRKLDILECNRCGEVTEVRKPEFSYEWMRIRALQYSGTFVIGFRLGGDIDDMDICPSCSFALKQWWVMEAVEEQTKLRTVPGKRAGGDV